MPMDVEHPNQRQLTCLQMQVRKCLYCESEGLPTAGRPVFSGPASARVMVVGQWPSRSDDSAGRLWSGPTGRRLMAWLSWAGLEESTLRARHYLTTVVKCYPGRDTPGHRDRPPTRPQIQFCRKYLDAELALVAPRLVIPIGRLAIDFFGGRSQRLERLVGKAVRVDETWIVPLPHPSGTSLWLNEADHRDLLARALTILKEFCQTLEI